MFLKIIKKISKTDINLAKANFIEKLSSESLIARYEIFKYSNKIPNFNKDWIPIFKKDFCFSISHKKNLVFIWVDNKDIWIDIEIIKKRSSEAYLLHKISEYDIFGKKNLKNFYFIWTIKESVLKLNLMWLENINNIKIQKTENIEKTISGLNFTKKTYSILENKKIITYSGIDENIIYSYSLFY